jgi:aminoglycoside phosphotransferase (APT) family kinase protein
VASDTAAAECDVPALLLSREPGAAPDRPTDLAGFVAQLAEALPAVHAIDPDSAARVVPPYRPYYKAASLSVPGWARTPAAWERAVELAAAPVRATRPTFIHRDYHQGNTLWADGRLTAIVDWTTASIGPAAVDISHMRANLVMAFGIEAADEFLAAYRAVAPAYVHDPRWDLRSAVDFLPELSPEPKPELDRLDEFVARAVAAL